MDSYFSLCRQAMLALLGSALLVISCTDDMDNIPQSECIRFISDVQHSWISMIEEGADEVGRSSVRTLRTGMNDTLYLHTLYTDSIESRFLPTVFPSPVPFPEPGIICMLLSGYRLMLIPDRGTVLSVPTICTTCR